MINQSQIRNFAIVAHIDHGKSTLADRLLEDTKTIEQRHMKEQVLDSNPIERERGITIKLAPVRMKYELPDNLKKTLNLDYCILNLIDTPGHVDFSYEVSRSLSACEGIILVVDATSGIQAQTVAHMQLIQKNNLKVIPVINKIDLDTAKIEKTKKSLIEAFSFKEDEIIEISAKNGTNIDKVLEAVVTRIPCPKASPKDDLRALVFSSQYDTHQGVIVFVRIVDGKLDNKAKNISFIASKASFKPIDYGIFTPKRKSVQKLTAGEVGYISTGLKDISKAKVGDTLTFTDSSSKALPGYKEPKPMVYLSLFPTENKDFALLREALDKLHLSDSSFTYDLYSSPALGKGFLCGFLGLLHAEIVKERLEREFLLNIITTSPTVEYEIIMKNKAKIKLHTPENFPNPSEIEYVLEPVMLTTIYTPENTIGGIMQLCEEKRAKFVNLEYVGKQAKLSYIIPLSEMIIDFYNSLKSISSGYASMDYEFYEYQKVDVVKLDILVHKNLVNAFSQIVVKEKAQLTGKELVEKLKTLIPKHQFQIPIQACIGGKIIARSDVKAFRKDVTAKLYGGDRTRKDKLLKAQKKGKQKMRQFGKVNIPQDVFMKIFKRD